MKFYFSFVYLHSALLNSRLVDIFFRAINHSFPGRLNDSIEILLGFWNWLQIGSLCKSWINKDSGSIFFSFQKIDQDNNIIQGWLENKSCLKWLYYLLSGVVKDRGGWPWPPGLFLPWLFIIWSNFCFLNILV